MAEATEQGPIPQQAAPVLEGVRVLDTVLPTLPLSPGVYRMLDARGEALYVGKARALR